MVYWFWGVADNGKVKFPKADLWRAIRQKCLDCFNEQYTEVEKCPITKYPLYTYRFGSKSASKTCEMQKKRKHCTFIFI